MYTIKNTFYRGILDDKKYGLGRKVYEMVYNFIFLRRASTLKMDNCLHSFLPLKVYGLSNSLVANL